MFPSVIFLFLFSLLALVQAIPCHGLQRSRSPCIISPARLGHDKLATSWTTGCVVNLLKENDIQVPATCRLKLFHPNQHATNHPIILQDVAVPVYDKHVPTSSYDLDLRAGLPCKENYYAVKLVCPGQSGRYVLAAESDHQFGIC
ncbi:hypothetical protein BC827DRAFT_1248365 [Russula dissimulans]|nr:hypothetical protein BC827DRAFT_1248365 [Russula dissimulans]